MARRSLKKKEAPAPAKPDSSELSAWLNSLATTWRSWLPRVSLIFGLTLWIYWPALNGDFIWDDGWYLTNNPLVQDLNGLWKFWFQPGTWVEYYPIQETVQWVQWQLWGKETLGYHLTNLFLHLVSALLVWRLLAKFGLRFAWLGGLIFAVHPVQVESVAYISELKNTLSLPFFLLAMGRWIDFDEHRRKQDYQWALFLFVVAMLCKISMAPFPLIILLYAWWKHGRVERKDLVASAPFFVVSLVLGYATVWAGSTYVQVNHAIVPETPLSGLFSRIEAVGLDATVYFARCFLPGEVMLVYPQWPLHSDSVVQYLPWLVFAGTMGLLWSKRRTWGRHALLGLGFFLLMLLPFLGFIAVSYMNFIWVLDHLLYLPIIGLIGLFVAFCEGLRAQIPTSFRPLATGLFALIVALMAWQSHAFAELFVNEETLWTYVLQRNPTVWIAHDDLGVKLVERKRYDEAIVQLQDALALRPNYWDGYFNLGIAYDKLGRETEAEPYFRKALSLNPNNPDIYLNLGEMLRRQGHLAEAESLFRQGLKIEPDNEALCINLGGMLFQSGRADEAISLYEQAVAVSPKFAQLQYNLGTVLLQTGDVPKAADHLATAVELDPKLAPAHASLGVALARGRHFPEAIDEFQAALAIGPDSAEIRDNLALALTQSGDIAAAIDQFRKALDLDPNDAKARDGIDKLQQFQMQQK